MNVRRHEESGTADAAKESPLPRIAQALAVFLAALAVTVRPMCSDLGAPLHRNILVYLLVFMSVLLVTLRIALRKRVEVQAGGFTVAVLAFIGITVLTTFLAEYRYAAVQRMLELLAWGVLALVLVQVISSPFRGRILLAALVATLAVLAVNGLYQYFTVLPEIRQNLSQHVQEMTASGVLQPSLVKTFEKRAETGDVFGTFTIANSFAGYLIILLPVTCALAISCWRRRVNGTRAVGIVMGLVGLAGFMVLCLTRSKGGILSLGVALAAGIAWGWRGYLGRKRAGITAAGVVLLAVFLTAQGGKTAPETDKYPMEKAQATDEKHTGWEGILGDSAEVRIQYWKASWEVFREHSILGVGPGNFADSYLAHRTPRGSETRYAHNDYVEVTVEQGLAGLVAYLAMWAIWFWCMRRDATKSEEGKADTEAEDRRSRRGFALLIGAVGVAGVLFTMNQFIPTGETWMMILVGIAAWVGVYWVQARRAVDAPEELNLRLARGAILIGVCAFLIHSAIDFDFDVPGVMMPLAGMLAVGIALRQKTGETKVRTFGTRGQLTLTALVAAPLGLILIFILYPLIDMSVALEEAQKLVENQNLTVQMAMDARKRGDDKTFEEYMTRAQRIADVEIPARYRSAIEAYPGNAEPYVELARLEAAPLYDDPTSDRSKVERLLDDAKRLRPCDPTPWVMLAEMLSAQIAAAEEKGRADLIPALAQAGLTESEGAIKRYPAQPRLRLIRARLLGRLTRPAEAIKEYETALFLAEETSEKELKFTPEVVKGIEESMEKLKAKE